MDSAFFPPLAYGITAILLQCGNDGRSLTGVAQFHMEILPPVTGSTTDPLSATLPVCRTCMWTLFHVHAHFSGGVEFGLILILQQLHP